MTNSLAYVCSFGKTTISTNFCKVSKILLATREFAFWIYSVTPFISVSAILWSKESITRLKHLSGLSLKSFNKISLFFNSKILSPSAPYWNLFMNPYYLSAMSDINLMYICKII